jgi:hypothetical protein
MRVRVAPAFQGMEPETKAADRYALACWSCGGMATLGYLACRTDLVPAMIDAVGDGCGDHSAHMYRDTVHLNAKGPRLACEPLSSWLGTP